MICPHCQKENPESARFCPRCGRNMFEEAAAAADIQPVALPRVNTRLSARSKIIIAGIIILVIGYFAYQYFTKPLTPDQAAQTFMADLKEGNFAEAYSLLDDSDFIGREYLTEDCFKEAFAANKVTEYKLEIGGEEDQVQTSFFYILNAGGERSEGVLELINRPLGKKDNWKINPQNFIVNSEINTLPELTVKVNDKSLKTENGSLSLPMFQGYTFKVAFEHPDIQTLKIDAQAGDYVERYNVAVNPALQAIIEANINGYNEADVQACKDLDISHYKNFVKENSYEWNDLCEGIDSYRYYEFYTEAVLKEIKISNIRFADSMNIVLADSDISWEGVNKNNAGEVIEEFPDQLLRMTYTFEKQENGSWLITESYER